MPSTDVDQKPKSFTSGHVVIWLGIICGNLEFVLSIIYAIYSQKTMGVSYRKAWATFIILQPIWYLFISVLYIA
jgi:hypothetical protein